MPDARRVTKTLELFLCLSFFSAGYGTRLATPARATIAAPASDSVAPTLDPVAPASKPAPRGSNPDARAPEPAADILIFAPHPDDETFCCATVIQRAAAEGKRIHVVYFTNGDGFAKAASDLTKKPPDSLTALDFLGLARVRQSEAFAAATVLGLHPADLTFLGYPDGGLAEVYGTTGDPPYQQRFTKKSETYGAVVSDYHSRAHGAPASYERASLSADVVELLRIFKPAQVYFPNDADTHPDHQAAFRLVRDALGAVDYRGQTFTYALHASGYPCPPKLPCPPPVRISPTPEQAETKFKALLCYQSQVWEFFYSEQVVRVIAGLDESFWPVQPDTSSR
jgi:LmbE family N-acetylglucosaminyl deacetylase